MKKTLAAVMTVILIVSLSGCGDRHSKEDVNMEKTAKDIEYMMNMRYYGYSEADNEKIESMCDTQTSSMIISALEGTEENIFISLEDLFIEYENEVVIEEDEAGNLIEYNPYSDKITDSKITTVNGARGVYGDDIMADESGQFMTLIYGDTKYVDVPSELLIRQLRHIPSYKFKVSDYGYYDKGKCTVTLESDLEGAFEEIYKNVTITDKREGGAPEGLLSYNDINSEIELTQEEYQQHRQSFMETYYIKKITLSFKFNSEGKITGINTDSITGALI